MPYEYRNPSTPAPEVRKLTGPELDADDTLSKRFPYYKRDTRRSTTYKLANGEEIPIFAEIVNDQLSLPASRLETIAAESPPSEGTKDPRIAKTDIAEHKLDDLTSVCCKPPIPDTASEKTRYLKSERQFDHPKDGYFPVTLYTTNTSISS